MKKYRQESAVLNNIWGTLIGKYMNLMTIENFVKLEGLLFAKAARDIERNHTTIKKTLGNYET